MEDKANMKMIEQLYDYLITTTMVVLAFFAPTGKWLLFIGFLVAADMVLGILAAFRCHEEVTSRRMARTVAKYAAYGIAIIVSHYVVVLFSLDFPVIQTITAFIAVVELKSIDEKIKKITGHSLLDRLIEILGSKKR